MFQRALDTGRQYLKENAVIVVRGKISVRDEKEPQIMVDSISPITAPGTAQPAAAPAPTPAQERQKLYLRLKSTDAKARRRIELLLEMFPGRDQMILYFEDNGKRLGADCVIHGALLRELREMLGEQNVVVK